MKNIRLACIIMLMIFTCMSCTQSNSTTINTEPFPSSSMPVQTDSELILPPKNTSPLKTEPESSSTANAVPENEPQEFLPEDATAFSIKIDMLSTEVIDILGEPISKDAHYEGAFGADVYNYYYDFGHVRLEPGAYHQETGTSDYIVSHIIIEKPGYDGPRSIRIGDNVNSVIQKFPCKSNSIGENRKSYLYGNGNGNYGIATYDDNSNIMKILYIYGGPGFGAYSLLIEFENSLVKLIRVGVMNV